MRVLSIVACGRLAERHCRKAGEPVSVEHLVGMRWNGLATAVATAERLAL